jgi:sulfoxide reductase heme-binding subunit YedZ
VTFAATNATWYVARAGGLTAFALLTGSVAIGLLLSGRAKVDWPRFAITEVHRFVGLLAGAFIAVHGLTLLLDGYYHFTLWSLLVPGTAPYRALATALGILAAELLAALALTNHYRTRLSFRFWRRAHYLNFAVWLLALVHGVTAGTDRDTAWALLLYAFAGATVGGLAAWRALQRLTLPDWALWLWPATAAVVTAELVIALDRASVRA